MEGQPTAGYSIQTVQFKDVYKDLIPLFEAHWNEVGLKKFCNFDLDIEFYKQIESQLISLVLKKDNEIIGYLQSAVHRHNHSKGLLCNTVDCFYIKPEFRGLKTLKWVYELIRTNEWIAFMRGCKISQLSIPNLQKFYNLADNAGYEDYTATQIKRLG